MDEELTEVPLDDHAASEVAVIGFAGRFPGARNTDEFWRNLRDGVESISFFSQEELLNAGADPEQVGVPEYVPAKAILEDVELFDANFFDYSPREAEMLDPQLRVMLECAVEAFEHAGYDPERFKGRAGVYAGVSAGSYLEVNLSSHAELIERVGPYQVDIGNHGEFVPTTISFKLNLKGPSINIQTACSTSLVAVHVACQSLLNGECDIALAGGGSVTFPHIEGYYYQEEGILSPDGHCRAFDADARGTVGGEGAALVVLKRLVDALADGDTIHAVIKGSAVNNDGSVKIGFTAPSVNGQAEVISDALAMAAVGAESISYIETHGTGTALGDPVEIAALTQAFHTDRPQLNDLCAIGSLKSNIGHLDAAAGVAGLIKTILALKHSQLPPSLHYQRPNPKIDFAASGFFVNDKLSDWKRGDTPRRAGISSFGIGGTNAHVVVEEAPATESSSSTARPLQLLLLSAKTASALESTTANIAEYLKQNGDANLADVAYTLQVGRAGFAHRRVLTCKDTADALAALESRERVMTLFQEPRYRPVVFMFPGQGTQHVGMARELYELEPTFREHLDICAEHLIPHLNHDLREVLYPNAAGEAEASRLLGQTLFTQPALFAIEYALAQLWMSWGVKPASMIGHSIGEYVAAVLSRVLSLEDALALVAMRGKLMQSLPEGSMLAVMLSEKETRSLLHDGLSVAAVNGAKNCVVSGPSNSIQELHDRLNQQDIHSQPLHTSHAFHSAMMEPILEPFTEFVRKIELGAPVIPFISNVTGSWINASQTKDASYWSRHLRQTVRFADGIGEVLTDSERILIEVGPGQTLGALAKQHSSQLGNQVIISSLPRPRDEQPAAEFLLTSVARFWLAGGQIDWEQFYANEQRRRVPLPTYPFERQRYYLEPVEVEDTGTRARRSLARKLDVADWFYLPSWRQRELLRLTKSHKKAGVAWLIFCDDNGIGDELAKRLKEQGDEVIVVYAREQLRRSGLLEYTIDPCRKEHYEALVKEVDALGREAAFPDIIHLWSTSSTDSFDRAQELGLYSLILLAQALTEQTITGSPKLMVVTDSVYEVVGSESLHPEQSTILGACKVIPQENPGISCRSLDFVVPRDHNGVPTQLIEQLQHEIKVDSSDRVVAYRGKQRWVQDFEPVRIEKGAGTDLRLKDGGVYLITGGLGAVGFALAQHLTRNFKVKLALLGRTALPPREEWSRWIEEHEYEDEVSDRISAVQELESAGAEVLVLSADVANEEQMRTAVDRIVERFGRLDGVIYGAAAGENTDKEIRVLTRDDCARQFHAKVKGLQVVEKVIEDRDVEFCLLLSSLSSVLGGMTFTAYAAANCFMDTFVRKHNQSHSAMWMTVNWDAWNFEEESKLLRAGEHEGIRPGNGGDALERILSMGPLTQVLVSTSDLHARLDRWVTFEAAESTEVVKEVKTASALHPRPNLLEAYVAPSNELEEDLANTWQELLGIGQVGVNDNFFELGGHSLLATMVMSRLRKEFGVELSLRSFFESPTINGLALLIAERVIEEQDEESIARLLEGAAGA